MSVTILTALTEDPLICPISPRGLLIICSAAANPTSSVIPALAPLLPCPAAALQPATLEIEQLQYNHDASATTDESNLRTTPNRCKPRN